MKIFISRSTVASDPECMMRFVESITDDMAFLRGCYPDFDEWLLDKVIPGIYSGERTAVVELRDSAVAGLLIVKHTDNERKLCTLRVRPDFECRGLGVRLFEAAFELLGTDRPLLSISEPSIPKFARLLTHFGFSKEAVYGGRYLPHVNEISYNGFLEPTWTRRVSSQRSFSFNLKTACSVPECLPHRGCHQHCRALHPYSVSFQSPRVEIVNRL